MSEVRGEVTPLTEEEAGRDPIALFGRWFEQAGDAGLHLPEAMTLATATADGAPSARKVLLKEYGPDGFVFYTNYGSRKARELDSNPRAALLFHWSPLERQVRIEGRVERTLREESEAYHRTRPRGSRIGAWASEQSSVIGGRTEMERQFEAREREFAEGDIPLPPFWGGYRVRPERIEFWQGRENRMHDRLVFHRDRVAGEGLGAGKGEWRVSRLSP